jgi:hypothetical protein
LGRLSPSFSFSHAPLPFASNPPVRIVLIWIGCDRIDSGWRGSGWSLIIVGIPCDAMAGARCAIGCPSGTAEGVCVMANSTARIKQLTAELLQHLGCSNRTLPPAPSCSPVTKDIGALVLNFISCL